MSDDLLTERKARARAWFEALRDRIHAMLEGLEDAAPTALYPGEPGRFVRTPWQRPEAEGGGEQGGGTMGMLRGRLFEKAGVHTSTVHGAFNKDFAGQIKGASEDPRFWASGLSLIVHPKNPLVPAVHMNTRFIVTTEWWFGGGADLNPMVDAQRERGHQNAVDFHGALQAMCGRFGADLYERFAKWAEEYFFLPHRGEHRGVGGIFYDHHRTDWEADFAFSQAVGECFLAIYPELVRRHFETRWSDDEAAQQGKWRGRYVEFNLLYDRGTTFGLKTGGNVESILSSMPPVAEWR